MKTSTPRRTLLFLLVSVLLAHGRDTVAQPSARQVDRMGLKGLQAVVLDVLVLDGTPEHVRVLLMKKLRERLELRLRMGGVTVLDEHDAKATTGDLSLNLDAPFGPDLKLLCPGGWSAFHLELELTQVAFLARGNALVFPVTWGKYVMKFVPLDEYQAAILKEADGLADKFLNEWLKWNPKR